MRISKKALNSWIKEENDKLKNHKRSYLHFDRRISHLTEKNTFDIRMPDRVVGHSFYPFILRVKKWRRYKKSPDKKRKKIELKERPIAYAAHYDSLIFSWYSYVLKILYEKKIKNLGISSNIKAYRKLSKNNIDFNKEIVDFVKTKKECAIMCFDLEKFFDNLDHGLIKKRWGELIGENFLPQDHYFIFRNITNYSFIELSDIKDLLRKRKHSKRLCSPREFRRLVEGNPRVIKKNWGSRGIPQGSTISDVLSNLYMLPVDLKMGKLLHKLSGFYQRYCDDIIIVCPLNRAFLVEKTLKGELKKIKLKLNKSKTEKKIYKKASKKRLILDFHTKKPSKLQYLGIEFIGKNFLLRHSGIANYERKMARTIKKLARRSMKRGRAFPRKKILKRFFFSRNSNYLTYAGRASKSLNSRSIQRQLSPNRVMRKIKNKINKALQKK